MLLALQIAFGIYLGFGSLGVTIWAGISAKEWYDKKRRMGYLRWAGPAWR